jgi:DNA polymerase-3 subunit delta
MIYKSFIVEQNILTIEKNKMFLFYGENNGLKNDLKNKIISAFPKTGILNLFQDEIVKDRNILINEISNKSLFDEKKIIFINEANDKILEILEQINNMEDENIYIYSNNLDKRSKLRAYFEKSKTFGVTACYPDNDITIKKIISTKLKEYSGLTAQVISTIIQNTGLDRNKINNEIEKIQTCFSDKKINLEKLALLLNIKTNEDFDHLKDHAINGNKKQTNRLLADTIFETEKNVYYLNSINQRINKLKEIERISENSTNIESIIENLKPPVFWKDKPILIEQSKKWNKKKINEVLKKTYIAELEIKSGSSSRKDLIIKNLIIELCSAANGSSVA